MIASSALATRAPAKVNLTLHVLGRRADGYHELDSLVVFAGAADLITLTPASDLSLDVRGTTAVDSGPPEANLVVRAARALAARRPGLRLGAFALTKRLPAAAGIGGGSSDAASALRLLARLNGFAIDDPDVVGAAQETGADIPVCLDPRARTMRGAGERVGPPLCLPPIFSVLVNPRVAVPTAGVFRAIGLEPGQNFSAPGAIGETPPHPFTEGRMRASAEDLLGWLRATRNDLEPPALALAPPIRTALDRLAATPGCRLARMSGSGATVFGLYDDCKSAATAARAIVAAEPAWWVKPTVLR